MCSVAGASRTHLPQHNGLMTRIGKLFTDSKHLPEPVNYTSTYRKR